ncbi:virginiamycin B lyase family protein, partial [Streptomyces variabilis]
MPFSHTPSVTQFRLTDDKAGPYGIVAGPDGALWLTLVHRGSVARLTLDGAFEEYPLDAAGCRPTVIAAGPDGALWFTRFQDPRYLFRGPARGPLAFGPGMTVAPCRTDDLGGGV